MWLVSHGKLGKEVFSFARFVTEPTKRMTESKRTSSTTCRGYSGDENDKVLKNVQVRSSSRSFLLGMF